MIREPALTAPQRRFLGDARRAILVTVAADGRPRPVPVCHVLLEERGSPVLFSPIDEKPKASTDPAALARVRDIAARPDVAVLVDRWHEDWSELAWLRADGSATLIEPGSDGHAAAVVALRAKYPQYEGHRLEERPIIRVVIRRTRSWGRLP